MHWLAKCRPAILVLLVASCPLLASEKKPKEKGKGKEPKESKEGKDKGKTKQSAELNIPIPIGHGAQGVRIPYYDEKGKLQMIFSIASATRVDETHLQMDAVQIETYAPTGEPEMAVEANSSVLDLNTKVVTSNEPATIRRSDFEITGDTMQFNTKTRDGKMSGNIRMLIYNTQAPEDGSRNE